MNLKLDKTTGTLWIFTSARKLSKLFTKPLIFSKTKTIVLSFSSSEKKSEYLLNLTYSNKTLVQHITHEISHQVIILAMLLHSSQLHETDPHQRFFVCSDIARFGKVNPWTLRILHVQDNIKENWVRLINIVKGFDNIMPNSILSNGTTPFTLANLS